MGGDARTRLDAAGTGHGHGSARRSSACALALGAGAGYAVNRDDTHGRARLLSRHQGRHANARSHPARGRCRHECRRSERPLTWNLRGPQGPAGIPGAAGPAGPGRGPPAPPGPQAPPAAAVDCDLERRIAAAVPAFQTSGACAPPPPCSDDGFEPNDTLAQATPVDLGTTTSGVACAANDDYLRRPRGGCDRDGDADVRRRRAMLEVALLDSSGAVLASASGSSPQSVSDARSRRGHRLRARARRGQRAGLVHALALSGSTGTSAGPEAVTGLPTWRKPVSHSYRTRSLALVALAVALALALALSLRGGSGPDTAFAAATAAPGSAIAPGDRTLTFTRLGRCRPAARHRARRRLRARRAGPRAMMPRPSPRTR